METWSLPTANSNPSDFSTLRIAGFGACMITGYPHEGGGMFETACGFVERHLSRPVQPTIFSLGGFSAPRAEKYLRKNLFKFNPEYVVIQFGATDAQCPLGLRRRPTDHSSNNSSTDPVLRLASYHAQPATELSRLRWRILSLIGYLRKVEPRTPLSRYIAAIERIAEDCRSEGIKPVILSPFVYGPGYAMRKAIPYVDALRERSRAHGAIFVDCVSLLTDLPKFKILQHDGIHLSRLGQKMVGEAIGKAIVEDIISSRSLGDERQRQFG